MKERATGNKVEQNKVEIDIDPGKRRGRQVHWIWPISIAFAGIGAAATVLLRGCWHNSMSWPTRAEDEHGLYSYQVCMNCGVKRLFDERSFRGYGSYDYDLRHLIARDRLERRRRMEEAALSKPSPPPQESTPRKDEA